MKLIAKDINGNDHEVESNEVSWRIHAYGVIIEDNKILLSPQHGDAYVLPGGKVELEEMLEAGLVREIKEETGIDVTVVELLGVKDNFFKVTFREPQEVWHSVLMYYKCTKIGGEISIAGFDEHEKQYVRAAEWVDISLINDIKQASSVDYLPLIHKVIS